jgi:glycosyltransferase involved in cell wall biosynthesis
LNQPKVSVLIPTFNYARYLPEAIESVLSQDFRDFELLIADDCSTDNTAEVVKPYVSRDPRVRLIVHSKNMGMVNNWNFCLQQARGEQIKYVFGDDRLFSSRALGRMSALLDANPSATLVACARIILDESSKVVNLWRHLPEGRHDGRKIITACLMKDGQNIVGEPSVVLFRKADAARGFNLTLKQLVDVEMWFHLLEKGDLVYTREALCAFRCHALQQTELNSASGVGRREHAVFFSHYAIQPWVPRKVILPLLWHLRRKRRKDPGATTPELLECEQRLIDSFGKGLRLSYLFFYIRYRVTIPFLNLRQSIQKRIARRKNTPVPGTV